MPVPVVYSKASRDTIATYNYYDLSSATGYRKYYNFLASVSGGNLNLVSPEAIEGSPEYTQGSATAATISSVLNYDFDLTYNMPSVIKGDFIWNGTWATYSTGNQNRGFFRITVYHVNSAGTETQIGTADTTQDTGTSTTSEGGMNYYRKCLKITLPQTKFKVGEKFRITVDFWWCHEGTGTGYWFVYFDPSDRSSFATQNTSMDYRIPYRIDL